MTDQSPDKEWATLGERIRSARESAGISVRELARRIDVSASHVSQVERGLASFSVRALYSVVNILGISMDSLFEQSPDKISAPRLEDEVIATYKGGPLDEAGIVLRRGSRPAMQLQSGPRWERLTVKPEVGAEFIEVIYQPAPGAVPPEDFIRHPGREYGVITKGTLSVQVGFGRSEMTVGDSIAFDSSIPHRFWNETAEEVIAVWFVLDAAAHDQDAEFPSADSAAHHHVVG
ncbi:MAG: helix-turn-helix transcriptional regulator [Microbacteriaceae bacterium]|jgi:transcriptional regulator with XRE-family HTH domain|nr:helix-turn-helix transcriptional regulator [Microbacteriaceae bacterium]